MVAQGLGVLPADAIRGASVERCASLNVKDR